MSMLHDLLRPGAGGGGGGGGSELPAVTSADNGKVLGVVNGAWAKDDRSKTVSVTGTAPSIALADNTVFLAGELTSLTLTGSLTDAQSCVIVFTSGSTETQLTVPSALLLPDSFVVEADKVYEISVMGSRGAVQSWAAA